MFFGRTTARFAQLDSQLGDLTTKVSETHENVSLLRTSQVTDHNRLVEAEQRAGRTVSGLRASISNLETAQQQRRPQASLLISLFSVIFMVISSMTGIAVFFVNSAIREAGARLEQRLATLERLTEDYRTLEERATSATTAMANDDAELRALRDRIASVERGLGQSITERREQDTVLQSAIGEHQLQVNTITSMLYYLWETVTGQRYPVIPNDQRPPRVP